MNFYPGIYTFSGHAGRPAAGRVGGLCGCRRQPFLVPPGTRTAAERVARSKLSGRRLPPAFTAFYAVTAGGCKGEPFPPEPRPWTSVGRKKPQRAKGGSVAALARWGCCGSVHGRRGLGGIIPLGGRLGFTQFFRRKSQTYGKSMLPCFSILEQ